MSDEVTDEEPAEPAAAKSFLQRYRRLLLFVGAPVLILLLAVAGLFISGVGQSLLGKKTDEATKAAAAAQAPKEIIFYDLPDMLVNLNTGGRKTSFLKMTVSLELEHQADQGKVQAVQPRIIDTFQTYLRELRPEDLRGSAGLYRLREELLMRVNAALAPVKVDDVLFRDMLVQ
jgi:flagellar FliL protein